MVVGRLSMSGLSSFVMVCSNFWRLLLMVIFSFFSRFSEMVSSSVVCIVFSLVSIFVLISLSIVLNLSSMYCFKIFSIESMVVGVVVVLLML